MISFLGVLTDRRTDVQTDGQTDRHGFGILTWKHVGTQKIQLKAQNYWLAVDPYMSPRRTGMHNNNIKDEVRLYFLVPQFSIRVLLVPL